MAGSKGNFIMPWGKYKGEEMSEIPDSYLRWCLEQDWIDKWPKVINAMQDELAYRDANNIEIEEDR